MVTGPILCPVLIGRTRELQLLVDRRLAAAHGKGSCVLLSGDAGMGKSRLLAEFRGTLSGGRAALGIGVAREFGNAPYAPVLEALAGIGAASQLSHELSREAHLEALTERLAAACRRRHAVFIVEDAQWADEGSLRFLLHVLPMLVSMRLLLVVTYRSPSETGESSLANFLPRFQRGASAYRIELGPLSNAELRQVAALALGERAPLPAQTIAEIVERSEGNPFFAEELLRNALERSVSVRAFSDLPLTIRAAVLERCAGLDETSRGILTRAAVLGRRFDARLLASICAEPLERVFNGLRRLRDLQLIEEVSAAPVAYAFRHAITRHAIYETMLRDELIPLHQSMLEALERNGASAFDLGYHAWAAQNLAQALRYNELAGDEALAVHAYADARLCFERALIGAQDARVRGRLQEKAAAAAARDGRADVAAGLYETAAQTFEETGDERRVAELYLSMSAQARIGGDAIASRAILRRAISRLSDRAAVEKAKLYVSLAFTYLDRCETKVAAKWIARAEAASESAIYASALTYAAAVRGDLAAVRHSSDEYSRRCQSESPEAALRARFNAGFSLGVLGADEEALEIFDTIQPELRERRLHGLEAVTSANAALLHERAGRWELARAAIAQGLSIPETTTTAPVVLAAAALTLACALRDDELALRCASSEAVKNALGSRINSTLGRIAGPYARWLRVRGENEEASRTLRDAMTLLAGPFAATETLIAAAELGDEATLPLALSHLPALEQMSDLPIYAATAAHVRAVAANRIGDGEALKSYATQAALKYRELEWPAHEIAMRDLCGVAPPCEIAPDVQASLLSPREHEIAALVVKGIPNKRLAEHLAVNRRTIEKHLTSIFGKLGVRNRTELTARMIRRS
ncbi:MAG: AAA family ATPase [Candidatus Eremiobacteraeota bacterium]|nr:AAA family ATPase [Candidatus Eremiobacteraeota bacterium]